MAYTPAYANPYLNQTTYQYPQTAMQQPQQYPQTQPAQQTPYQQPYNGTPVDVSEDQAMQIQLPPNSVSDPMFNRATKRIYVVMTDSMGGKTLKRYRYVEDDDEPISINGAEFASKDEFDQLSAKVEAIIASMEDKRAANEPAAAGAATATTDGRS